jgi:hypothetical protein
LLENEKLKQNEARVQGSPRDQRRRMWGKMRQEARRERRKEAVGPNITWVSSLHPLESKKNVSPEIINVWSSPKVRMPLDRTHAVE